MSNYLFAMGKEEKVRAIEQYFRQLHPNHSDEISLSHQFNDVWTIVVEQRAAHIESSIIDMSDNHRGYFFKGWFQDHESESIVIGSLGYADWYQENSQESVLDREGTYVHAHWTDEKLVIENDLFSYFPVVYFSTSELVVASDSVYVLSQLRKALGLPCKLNRKVMHSRAWTHGLACAVMSNHTLIQGIQLLSPGKHVETTFNRKFSTEMIHQPIKKMFEGKHSDYAEALIQATKQLYASTMSFFHVEGIHINFGLSGGLDSRLLLAILLKKRELLAKVSITTNTHSSRSGDFEVVSALAEKYGFAFNSKKEELREHRKNPSVESISEPNSFGFWMLSNLGLFDMMYLHNSYWKHPNILELGGHGAETVKGTFAPMRFENYLHRKTLSRKARFSRSYFRDRKQVKKSQKRYDSIYDEMKQGLASSGIDLDEEASIQWHHLCYKSPIQNGRYLDRSIIALRPYIQRSLFELSISGLNPFRGVKKGEPTLLHDMLILLDPELALQPFENSKNDLDQTYIESRLESINSAISFDDIQPYTIFGAVTDIVNGPPATFMAMVEEYDIGEKNPKVAVLDMLEQHWSKISNTKLGEVYQSPYDTAKERLLDPDFYPPSAGTPAAKIISLLMTDV